ncbi:hypothetical protein AB0A71_38935 [Kitasatospora aureofaciens]|uniref:hypothetical protein n=1 Tax=Kitasatospora aureofaciens TaxID=1894 RepID=UPI0033C95AD2
MHKMYREAGCPSTRRISKEVSVSPFSRDQISHQSVANMLTGKAFPGWLKWEALIGVLLTLAREEATADRIRYARQLWVPVHYGEGNSEQHPEYGLIDDSRSHPRPGPNQPKQARSLEPALHPEARLEAPGPGALDESDPDGSDELRTLPDEEQESNNEGGRRIRFLSGAWAGPEMFSVEHLAGVLQIGLNVRHPAGSAINKIIAEGDKEASEVLKLLLFSWALMEDETPGERARNSIKSARFDWSRYALLFSKLDDGDD